MEYSRIFILNLPLIKQISSRPNEKNTTFQGAQHAQRKKPGKFEVYCRVIFCGLLNASLPLNIIKRSFLQCSSRSLPSTLEAHLRKPPLSWSAPALPNANLYPSTTRVPSPMIALISERLWRKMISRNHFRIILLKKEKWNPVPRSPCLTLCRWKLRKKTLEKYQFDKFIFWVFHSLISALICQSLW